MKHKLINSVIKTDYVKNLLRERGIENVDRFLNASPEDIQSPAFFNNIDEGVAALAYVLNTKEEPNFLLIVDSDIDGFTSSAIMYNYIMKAQPNSKITYMLHEGKQHGLEDHWQDILEDHIPYDLIIIPDAASNDIEYTNKLSEYDFLILDHHILENEIGINVCLINNQDSPEYLNKDLSGAGVAWQFCRAMDMAFGWNYAEDLIDLAALGITGDMMGLNEIENQAIISYGFTHIKNKFFQTLVDKQDFSMGGKVNPTTVAFYIVPLVNAMIRVGTDGEKDRLFKAFIAPDELVPCNKRGAKGTMEKVCIESARECTNAKSKQDREKEKMTEKLTGRILENGLLDNKILFVELDDTDDFPSELNGLVAMQLASHFQRPTLLGRRNTDNEIKGSIRGLNESALTSLKDLLDESGLFMYCSGHDNAAGFGIEGQNLDAFHNFANNKLADMDFSEGSYDVNFERHALDADLKDLIMEIGRYDWLWGQKMSEPLIYVDTINLKTGEWRIMGQRKDTVSFEKNGVKYIQFHAQKLIEELQSHSDEVQIEVVGRASINEFNGYTTPQIMIKNYEVIDGKFAF